MRLTDGDGVVEEVEEEAVLVELMFIQRGRTVEDDVVELTDPRERSGSASGMGRRGMTLAKGDGGGGGGE